MRKRPGICPQHSSEIRTLQVAANSESLTWWPTGSHLKELFGPAYAVIGTSIGTSASHGITQPESGTIEDIFIKDSKKTRFISTIEFRYEMNNLKDEIPIRSQSIKNTTYFSLSKENLSEFDWILFLIQLNNAIR